MVDKSIFSFEIFWILLSKDPIVYIGLHLLVKNIANTDCLLSKFHVCIQPFFKFLIKVFHFDIKYLFILLLYWNILGKNYFASLVMIGFLRYDRFIKCNLCFIWKRFQSLVLMRRFNDSFLQYKLIYTKNIKIIFKKYLY